MEVVQTVKPLNMGWCLNCHRDPAPSLRPKDQVTNMLWMPPAGAPGTPGQAALGEQLKEKYHVNPNTDCVTCHR
jgi:hypothetical protein